MTIQGDPGHMDMDCPRVARRIECPYCGYPAAHACYLLPHSTFTKEKLELEKKKKSTPSATSVIEERRYKLRDIMEALGEEVVIDGDSEREYNRRFEIRVKAPDRQCYPSTFLNRVVLIVREERGKR